MQEEISLISGVTTQQILNWLQNEPSRDERLDELCRVAYFEILLQGGRKFARTG
jgi:hypothetical protein